MKIVIGVFLLMAFGVGGYLVSQKITENKNQQAAENYIGYCASSILDLRQGAPEKKSDEWFKKLENINKKSKQESMQDYAKYSANSEKICLELISIVEEVFDRYYKLNSTLDMPRLMRRATAKQRDEYLWKIEFWQSIKSESNKGISWPNEVHERLRKTIVNSGLPENLKIKVYSNVNKLEYYKSDKVVDIYRALIKASEAGKEYHDFLYKNPKAYIINPETKKFHFIDRLALEKYMEHEKNLNNAFQNIKTQYRLHLRLIKGMQ